MSRDEVRELLGLPDDVSVRRAAIWRYGNFEVHFEGDGAYLLFADGIHCLDAGPGRTLDRWIAAGSSFSKEETLSRLVTYGVPYQMLDGDALGTIARITDGADLSFHPLDKHGPPTEWTSICVLALHMRKPYRPLLEHRSVRKQGEIDRLHGRFSWGSTATGRCDLFSA
jgi:hypothetical protein